MPVQYQYQLQSVLLTVVCLLLCVSLVCGDAGTHVYECDECDDRGANMRVLLDSAERGLGDPQQWIPWTLEEENSWVSTGSNCEFTVCEYTTGPQDNWLISTYISRQLEEEELLEQVTLRIDYQFIDCSSGNNDGSTDNCEPSLNIMKYETSENIVTGEHSIDEFETAFHLRTSASHDLSLLQTAYVNISLSSEESGFFLAIRDFGTCIDVTRLVVFYEICPMEVVDFELRPETVAPTYGLVTVNSSCVSNAVSASGVMSLQCGVGGVWVESQLSECTCGLDYYPSEDRKNCSPLFEPDTTTITPFIRTSALCGPGYYISEVIGECLVCPDNSHSTETETRECPCTPGYYRPIYEVDQPCYLPPSPPRNLTVVSYTDTSVTISWLPPPSTAGGRDREEELKYSIWFKTSISTDMMFAGTTTNTTGQINGLITGVTYYLLVSTVSDITDQLSRDYSFKTFSRALMFQPTTDATVATSNSNNDTYSQITMAGVTVATVIGAVAMTIAVMALCFVVIWRKKRRTKSDNNLLISNEQAIVTQDNEPMYDTIDDLQLSAMSITPRNSVDSNIGPFVDSTNPSYAHSSDEEFEQFAEAVNLSYNADIDTPDAPVSYYNIEPAVTTPIYMDETINEGEVVDNTCIPIYMSNTVPNMVTTVTRTNSEDSDYSSLVSNDNS